MADSFRCVWFCEGGPDTLAAFALVHRAGRGDVLPVAMLGASAKLSPQALAKVAGKPCAIWGQDDKAGKKAVETWADMLAGAGCRVLPVIWPASDWHDGDVCEWLAKRGDELTASRINKLLPPKGPQS